LQLRGVEYLIVICFDFFEFGWGHYNFSLTEGFLFRDQYGEDFTNLVILLTKLPNMDDSVISCILA